MQNNPSIPTAPHRDFPLLAALREQKAMKLKGGIYHRLQVDLTYNSNHIEGSRLTPEQTRYIFETNTLGITDQTLNVDDIIETANHFHCIDLVIEHASDPLSEAFIKRLHLTLKTGTSDSRKEWFRTGAYKRLPNEVGGCATCPPERVARRMRNLLAAYNALPAKTVEDIIAFHHDFEAIHPFQDGNGRVGRLIILKECLAHGIVPFIISEDLKLFYYRGLRQWNDNRGYLINTCLAAQDNFKALMKYFRIRP